MKRREYFPKFRVGERVIYNRKKYTVIRIVGGGTGRVALAKDWLDNELGEVHWTQIRKAKTA